MYADCPNRTSDLRISRYLYKCDALPLRQTGGSWIQEGQICWPRWRKNIYLRKSEGTGLLTAFLCTSTTLNPLEFSGIPTWLYSCCKVCRRLGESVGWDVSEMKWRLDLLKNRLTVVETKLDFNRCDVEVNRVEPCIKVRITRIYARLIESWKKNLSVRSEAFVKVMYGIELCQVFILQPGLVHKIHTRILCPKFRKLDFGLMPPFSLTGKSI